MERMELKTKRAEAEKQREQALANANFCAGMVRVYDELIAAQETPSAPPVEEGT